MFRALRRAHHHHHQLKVSTSIRRQVNSIQAPKKNPSQPFEEESLPWYDAAQFYPVRIGETIDSRYRVIGKLGYGAYSTVWLCRNVKYLLLFELALQGH